MHTDGIRDQVGLRWSRGGRTLVHPEDMRPRSVLLCEGGRTTATRRHRKNKVVGLYASVSLWVQVWGGGAWFYPGSSGSIRG